MYIYICLEPGTSDLAPGVGGLIARDLGLGEWARDLGPRACEPGPGGPGGENAASSSKSADQMQNMRRVTANLPARCRACCVVNGEVGAPACSPALASFSVSVGGGSPRPNETGNPEDAPKPRNKTAQPVLPHSF